MLLERTCSARWLNQGRASFHKYISTCVAKCEGKSIAFLLVIHHSIPVGIKLLIVIANMRNFWEEILAQVSFRTKPPNKLTASSKIPISVFPY